MTSVADRFKVGDRVKLVSKFTGSPGWVMGMQHVLDSGEVGEVTRVDHNYGPEVHFPSIERWFYCPSSLAPADAPRSPKAGDRVEILPGAIGIAKHHVGQVVTLKEDGGGGHFWAGSAGGELMSLFPREYKLLPADPITLNGKAYTVQEGEGGVLTLTPVPLWEPKQGEIGRDKDGGLFLVTNEDEDDAPPLTVYLTGPVGETGTADPEDGDVLAFPTLKAAIAAGVL